MSSDWQKTTFAEAPFSVIDGDRGANYPKQHEFSRAGYCLFLNAGNVTQAGFVFSDCAFITEEKDSILRKGKLVRHDLVLTTRGTVGNVAYFADEVQFQHIRINSGMVILRPDQSRIDPYFLYLFLRSRNFSEQVAFLTSGSAQPQLPIRDMNRVEMPLPPLKDQRRICSTLRAIDDRITLLRETNATLEAIVQALFKSWFVDFDPVRAKVEGLEPEGMDAATAALFPDSFEESELGLVPNGWNVRNVYDVARVIYGAPFASKRFNTEGVGAPLVRIRDLKHESPGVYTDENHPKGYMIQPGDLVVGMDGEFRAYLWGGNPAWLNQRVCVFAPEHGVPAAFVHRSIMPLLAAVEASETATTVIHLGKNDIDRFRVVVPDPKILESFGAVSEPIYARIVENKKNAFSLSALHDTLLPRLISGQLRLPEAEEMVEEAYA